MTDVDGSPTPAIVLVTCLVLAAVVGVMLVDSLITSSELRRAARRLREMPDPPPMPAHTEN